MANICSYKAIVKGKKNACYAFIGSMPSLEGIAIISEEESEEICTVQFEGDCKWAVDAYCDKPWAGSFPVTIPEAVDAALEDGELKYMYHTVKERSKMFEVEVWCNSADIEDYDEEVGPIEIYEHYINGELVEGECPEELHIEVNDGEYIYLTLPL